MNKKKLPVDSIDPEKYYSASSIIQNGWFPWFKQPLTFLKRLKSKEGIELYRPVTSVQGLQTRYNIKGQTILDVIDLANEGKLEI